MTRVRVALVGAGFDFHHMVGLSWKDQVPGFAVGFEAHDSRLPVRIEAQHRSRFTDFDGDDVPEIERDYVGGDEVYVFLGVDGASFAGSISRAGFVGTGADALVHLT